MSPSMRLQLFWGLAIRWQPSQQSECVQGKFSTRAQLFCAKLYSCKSVFVCYAYLGTLPAAGRARRHLTQYACTAVISTQAFLQCFQPSSYACSVSAMMVCRAMGGTVKFQDALAERLDLMACSQQQLDAFLAAHPAQLSPGASSYAVNA
jgi:hypothetical protein